MQANGFRENQRMIFYPALSMCMKRKGLLTWMYIFMWTVFQRQIVLRIFHRLTDESKIGEKKWN